MQNIMGISYIGYAFTWLLYFVINALYVWLVMILMFYFGVVHNNEKFAFAEGYGFLDVAGLYILYALSTIGFILFLSSFFNKAKVGAQVILFIFLGNDIYSIDIKLFVLPSFF